jgi:hypothetical protein
MTDEAELYRKAVPDPLQQFVDTKRFIIVRETECPYLQMETCTAPEYFGRPDQKNEALAPEICQKPDHVLCLRFKLARMVKEG